VPGVRPGAAELPQRKGCDGMRVYISDDDIESGVPESAALCPFAVATMRALVERYGDDAPDFVEVLPDPGPRGARVTINDYIYGLSDAANLWIKAFDAGEGVEPQMFLVKGI